MHLKQQRLAQGVHSAGSGDMVLYKVPPEAATLLCLMVKPALHMSHPEDSRSEQYKRALAQQSRQSWINYRLYWSEQE